MKNNSIADKCSDPTQELSIQIPCRMAERIDAFAQETGNSITGVVIEAMDKFLREHKNRSS